MNESGQAVGIPAVLLLHFLHFLDTSPADEFVSKFQNLTVPSPFQISRQPEWDPDLNGQHSLVQHIETTLSMGCSRPDDRIQITLNVAGLPLAWNGTVKSSSEHELYSGKDKMACNCKEEMCDCKIETYWIFTQLAIADGDASVLGFMGQPLAIPGSRTLSWARYSNAPIVDSRLNLSRADLGISALTPEYLDIDLLFLEGIPRKPSTSAQDLAHTVLHINQLYDRDLYLQDGARPAGLSSAASPTHHGPDRRTFVRDVLACFVDGGISWMKSAWSVFENELVPELQNKAVASGPFWRGFEGAFDEGLTASFSAAARAILGFHGMENTAASFNDCVKPITKLVAMIIDVRFWEFFLVPMLVQTSGKGDYALLSSVTAGQKIAVPVALASQDCSVRRCWVLEVNKGVDGQAWKIVNKSYLLGCRDLVPDGAVVVRRNAQRVYGSASP